MGWYTYISLWFSSNPEFIEGMDKKWFHCEGLPYLALNPCFGQMAGASMEFIDINYGCHTVYFHVAPNGDILVFSKGDRTIGEYLDKNLPGTEGQLVAHYCASEKRWYEIGKDEPRPPPTMYARAARIIPDNHRFESPQSLLSLLPEFGKRVVGPAILLSHIVYSLSTSILGHHPYHDRCVWRTLMPYI